MPTAFSRIRDVIDGADVILLGTDPVSEGQRLEKRRKRIRGYRLQLLDTQAYGMLNGDKIYSDAKARIEEYNKG